MWRRVIVFPACAGVILYNYKEKQLTEGVPRMCGGDPVNQVYTILNAVCSPHVRG